jgi:hypothetical protein
VKRSADWPTTLSYCRPSAASPAIATTANLIKHGSALSVYGGTLCIFEVSYTELTSHVFQQQHRLAQYQENILNNLLFLFSGVDALKQIPI